MTRKLPPQASVAEPREGGRLHAPSAERNVGPLCEVLCLHAPGSGKALEIASGTGQHMPAFARTCPGLDWQPTDVEDARLRSIDLHAADAALPNIRPAIRLDATTPDWPDTHGGQDLIVLVNLLHLISIPEAQAIIGGTARALAPGGTARALAPGGTFILYGPFMQAGELVSDGDRSFHEALQASDPAIGYKDEFDVIDWMHAAGLELAQVINMPANNLCLVAKRP